MLIYSILNKKVFYKCMGKFWDAALIPYTTFMAYVQHDGTLKSKKTLVIFDLEKE